MVFEDGSVIGSTHTGLTNDRLSHEEHATIPHGRTAHACAAHTGTRTKPIPLPVSLSWPQQRSHAEHSTPMRTVGVCSSKDDGHSIDIRLRHELSDSKELSHCAVPLSSGRRRLRRTA